MFNACQVIVLFLSSLFMIAIAESNCIDFEKHSRELESCCDLRLPFPSKGKWRQCEKYALQKSQRNERNFNECCYELLGIVNGSDIIEPKMSEYLQEYDESSRQFLIVVYQECGDLISNRLKYDEPCNSFSFNLEVCVLLRLDADCPEQHYHQSEICDRLKAGEKFCE